MKKNETRVVW